MPWKKGESGNPGGSTREKVFQGLFRAIGNEIETASGKRKARVLAEKVYALAMNGESWAAHLVMDRVDGRAAMEATMTIQSNQELKVLSDDELMMIIAKQQAAAAAEQQDDEPKTLQ